MYYIVETFVLYARTSGAQEIARFVVLCLKMAMAVFGRKIDQQRLLLAYVVSASSDPINSSFDQP
jgi:hypothetical protein